MKKLMVVCVGLLQVLGYRANAKEGVQGEAFPIVEEDLSEVIKKKLADLQATGNFELHQQEIKERIEKSIRNPHAVINIRKAITYHSHLHDPSIIVPHNLKDHHGRIFHKAGTRVNPLDTRSLSKPLLFIDGDDVEQVDWALSAYRSNNATKIILIKGSPFDLSEKHDIPIYFDQAGKLSEKLKIEEVPTRVTQKGKHLLVESFPISHEHKNHQ
jgi:conjugal transfer pilus assembly protein TraW